MAIPATRLTLDAVTPRRRGLMLPTLALVAVCYLGFANGSRHSYKNDIRSDHTEEAVVDSNIEENDHTRVALVGPCVNLRRECARYAAAGRCSQDPRWMHPHCPVACGVCHLRIQSVPRHRQFGHYNLVYSGTVYDAIRDEILGVPQRLEPGQETAIRERVDNAIEYMKGVVMEDDRYRPVREICRTSHVDCAHWAILGECENNEEDMLKHCAPVCFVCEQLHMEAKCPIDPNEKHAWYPGDLSRMFENILSQPFYSDNYDITVLSRPHFVDGEDAIAAQVGPWVLMLDNFLSADEAKTLIDLGAAIGYERSTDVGEMDGDGTLERVVSEGRTSTNAWCNTVECSEDPVVIAVYDRILNLTQIPIVNSEPFQLLRYEPGQFYESHHDYIGYEIKQKQGVRILTVFLYLNDVEEGGETDYPRLSMTVKPKIGRALIWPSVFDDDPNTADDRTTHQALAVTRGIKFGANAWLHQRAMGEDCG